MPRKHSPRGHAGIDTDLDEPAAERYLLFPLGDKGTAAIGGEAAVALLTTLASESPARYALLPLKKKLAHATVGAQLLFELDGALRVAGRVDKVSAPDHYGASARERWNAAGASEIAAWTVLREVRPVSGVAVEQLVTTEGKALQLAPRIVAVKPKNGEAL